MTDEDANMRVQVAGGVQWDYARRGGNVQGKGVGKRQNVARHKRGQSCKTVASLYICLAVPDHSSLSCFIRSFLNYISV